MKPSLSLPVALGAALALAACGEEEETRPTPPSVNEVRPAEAAAVATPECEPQQCASSTFADALHTCVADENREVDSRVAYAGPGPIAPRGQESVATSSGSDVCESDLGGSLSCREGCVY